MAAAIRASLGSFKDDERERKRQKTDKETDTEEVASRDKFERSGFTPTIVDESAAPTPAPEPEPATPTEPAPAQGLRLGGLMVDRAQLERERLARQAARAGACGPSTAGASSTAGPSSSNAAASSSTAQASSANAQASSSRVTSSHTPSQSVRLSNHPVQSTGPFPRDAAGEYYPDGELRHVSLKIGSDSGARTFSPQDVFGGVSCPFLDKTDISTRTWRLWLCRALCGTTRGSTREVSCRRRMLFRRLGSPALPSRAMVRWPR